MGFCVAGAALFRGQNLLSAVTVNAACAIDRGGKIGLLRQGLMADIVLWDIGDYRVLPYHYGINPVRNVIKRGKIVID